MKRGGRFDFATPPTHTHTHTCARSGFRVIASGSLEPEVTIITVATTTIITTTTTTVFITTTITVIITTTTTVTTTTTITSSPLFTYLFSPHPPPPSTGGWVADAPHVLLQARPGGCHPGVTMTSAKLTSPTPWVRVLFIYFGVSRSHRS